MVVRHSASIDLPMQFSVPFGTKQLEFECLDHCLPPYPDYIMTSKDMLKVLARLPAFNCLRKFGGRGLYPHG